MVPRDVVTATLPGHDEAAICAWCHGSPHLPTSDYGTVNYRLPVVVCPAIAEDFIADAILALDRR